MRRNHGQPTRGPLTADQAIPLVSGVAPPDLKLRLTPPAVLHQPVNPLLQSPLNYLLRPSPTPTRNRRPNIRPNSQLPKPPPTDEIRIRRTHRLRLFLEAFDPIDPHMLKIPRRIVTDGSAFV